MATVEREKDRPSVIQRIAGLYGRTGFFLFIWYFAIFSWIIGDEIFGRMNSGRCEGADCFFQTYKIILLFLFFVIFLPLLQAHNIKAAEKDAPRGGQIWNSVKSIVTRKKQG